MDADIYKLICSQKHKALVVISGISCSKNKASSSGRSLTDTNKAQFQIIRILAKFSSGALFISTAMATPLPDALPTGGQVVQGSASIAQSGAQMDINQSSQRAVINWQGFDVGANAKVHIVQPNESAALLNRVVTNKPSEIFGKIEANGQVVLVNPNGIVFGKDGSASASSFTATTLDVTDQDFMDGKDRYSSNGSQGEIVNHGKIEAKNGGYVALLGAKVTNDGKIVTHNGAVALGVAESFAIPMTSSGKIKIQLSADSINSAIENTKNGVIVTEGGQVYLQAAVANNAMAAIKNSGQIDTSAEQAGDVSLLAENGYIKVDGSIVANSSNPAKKGGDIVIGRDTKTGKLAKVTDVSGAVLESKKGFVETSANLLNTKGARVKAGQWLLDPYNIAIESDSASSLNYSNLDSVIFAEDISANLSNGTSVTLATEAGGADVGNIAVNASIAKTGGADATLTLKAHNDITVAANTTISSNAGKLSVVFNSDVDGNGIGGIAMDSGSSITTNGGNIILGGGSIGDGSGFANNVVLMGTTLDALGGGLITIRGQGGNSVNGVSLSAGSLVTTDSDINIASNYSIVNNGAIKTVGSSANINLSSTYAGVSGEGSIGDTINKNASVTFTQGGDSFYYGVINAKNFTKGGTGSLSLSSWDGYYWGGNVKPSNISNAYTVQDGGALTLTSGKFPTEYPNFSPVSVNVVNNSTFALSPNINGFWKNTSFNFTGGLGGGTMDLGGNPRGGVISSNPDIFSHNVFSTSGGATNTITGLFNADSAYVVFDLANANSGTSMVGGGYAALQFASGHVDWGWGLYGATAIGMNGPGGLLFNDAVKASYFNINAGKVQVGTNLSEGFATKPILDVSHIYIDSGASLILNKSVDYAISSDVGGYGNIVQAGSGILSLTGNNSYGGTTTIMSNSTLLIGNDGSHLGAGDIINNGILAIDHSDNLTLSNSISGLGNLIQTGNGALTLTGNNTYTGDTAVLSGTLQVGNGGTTGSLGVANKVTNNGSLVFNRSNTILVDQDISGTGGLAQNGTGTTILNGFNNYAGTTIVNAGSLQIGNGSTTGTLGLGAVTNNANLSFNRSNTYIVANSINGTGSVSQSGTGTTVLAADNSYTGATAVSGGTLQIGNAGTTGTLGVGDVSLSNNANLSYLRSASTTIANNISGAGNVLATISGANNDLLVDHTIALNGGTVNLVTDANLAVTNAISTTNASNAAVFLEAGKSANAGTASGGDVTISGNGSIAVGSGGRTTIMTGSISGSTGLGVVAGNSRFNSDELTTNFTTAMGSGLYAIYREAPSATITINDDSKTYNGLVYTGGNGYQLTSGGVNGDTAAQIGANTIYGGTSQNTKNVGTYSITGSGSSGLGYNLTYIAGALTVNKAALTLSAVTDTKVYDGTINSNQAVAVVGKASGDTVTAAQEYLSKDVLGEGASTLQVKTGYSIKDSGNVDMSANYEIATQTSAGSITPKAVTLSAAKTYDGNLTLSNGQLAIGTGIDGESLGFSSATIHSKNVADNAINYVDSVNLIDGIGGKATNYQAPLLNVAAVGVNRVNLSKAALSLNAVTDTKVYDGNTSSNQAVTVSGNVSGDTVTAAQEYLSKDVLGEAASTLQVKTGYSIKDSSNVDMRANYEISTQTSAGSITPKAVTLSATKTYDGNLTLSNGQLTIGTGIDGESLGFSSATIHSKNVADNAINYVDSVNLIDGIGGKATNYQAPLLSEAAVGINSVNLSKAALTLNAVTDTKVYDGNTSSNQAVTVSGNISDDTVTASQEYQSKDVLGEGGSTLQVKTDYSIKDSSNVDISSNYDVSTQTSIGSITPKEVTLGNVIADSKVYDGNTEANISAGEINGTIAGEVLSISGVGRFEDANIGSDKTVTVENVATLNKHDGTGLWSNYRLSTVGELTALADITEPAPSVSNSVPTETDVFVKYPVELINVRSPAALINPVSANNATETALPSLTRDKSKTSTSPVSVSRQDKTAAAVVSQHTGK